MTFKMPVNNCKYSDWLTEYTFDNCKLNRKEYGEFLADYILGEKNGFVLNLNGSWGTGKTEFLRRFYTELHTRTHPVIYIDAWESDFSEVPLSVVSSELLNQLSTINENMGDSFDKVGEYLGKALKGAIIGGTGLITKHLLDDSAAGRELAKTMFESSPKDFLDKVKTDHSEQVDAIKQIRKELGLLAEVIKTNYSKELPVVVLIDELDRCRPNYAIEMLEVIKHFFNTDNFVFVVATDTEQLVHSIRSVYGTEFDSQVYLKRFFNREASLPEPDIEHYLSIQTLSFQEYFGKVDLYPKIQGKSVESYVATYLEWVARAFKLSIRDLDQLIDKLKACLRSASTTYAITNDVQYINIFTLIVALVEFDIKSPQFSIRGDNKSETKSKYIDFDIDEGEKFSQFYEFSLNCSVLFDVEVEGRFGDRYTEKLLYIDRRVSRELDSETKSIMFRNIKSSIANNISNNFSSQNSNLWMWPHYKKVVMIAGNIV